MAKLIDADALIEKIEGLTITVTGLRSDKGILHDLLVKYREGILQVIKEQPTVDAVEVVRCDDCAHYVQPEDGDFLGHCISGILAVSQNGQIYPGRGFYCLYGERKDK